MSLPCGRAQVERNVFNTYSVFLVLASTLFSLPTMLEIWFIYNNQGLGRKSELKNTVKVTVWRWSVSVFSSCMPWTWIYPCCFPSVQEVHSNIRLQPGLHVSSQTVFSVYPDSVKKTCLEVYTEICWVDFFLVHIDQTESLICIKLALTHSKSYLYKIIFTETRGEYGIQIKFPKSRVYQTYWYNRNIAI